MIGSQAQGVAKGKGGQHIKAVDIYSYLDNHPGPLPPCAGKGVGLKRGTYNT